MLYTSYSKTDDGESPDHSQKEKEKEVGKEERKKKDSIGITVTRQTER